MPQRQVSEHLVAALLESLEEGILSFSLDGTIETWSRGAERIYGYSAEEITGQPLTRLVPLQELPELETVFSRAGENVFTCFDTTERFRKDGSRVFVRIKRILIRDEQGGVSGILESGQGMDITDRKKSEEQAHYQARHDTLTGLADYREFMDRLEQEVRRAKRRFLFWPYSVKEHGQRAMVLFTVATWLNPCVGLAL